MQDDKQKRIKDNFILEKKSVNTLKHVPATIDRSHKQKATLENKVRPVTKKESSETLGTALRPELKYSKPRAGVVNPLRKPDSKLKKKEIISDGNPWQYKPNTSKVTAEQLVLEHEHDHDDILIDHNDNSDIQLITDLLEVHSKCSVLFTRRLVNQKLSEAIALLDMDCKSEILKEILQAIIQFLVYRPDFLVDQENDGYLVFTEMVRSEIFFFLDVLLNQRSQEITDAAAYNTKEVMSIMAKLEAMKEERDQIYEDVKQVVESIVPMCQKTSK